MFSMFPLLGVASATPSISSDSARITSQDNITTVERPLFRNVKESIRFIVVHCSATRLSNPYTPAQMERDHKRRGFRTIGYHFYITSDGTTFHPRLLGEVGAHVKGLNHCSIGVCYEGGLDENGKPADTRTPKQKERLLELLKILKQIYPKALIIGHNQLAPFPPKACPCFDAAKEYVGL